MECQWNSAGARNHEGRRGCIQGNTRGQEPAHHGYRAAIPDLRQEGSGVAAKSEEHYPNANKEQHVHDGAHNGPEPVSMQGKIRTPPISRPDLHDCRDRITCIQARMSLRRQQF
jgi:hypothetical protein